MFTDRREGWSHSRKQSKILTYYLLLGSIVALGANVCRLLGCM